MMDMSLDDIIKTNQKYPGRRGGGRGGRGGRGRGAPKGAVGAFRRIRTDFKQAAPYRKPRREEPASNFDDDTIWEHDLFQEEEEEEEEPYYEEENDVPIRGIETGTKVSIQNLEYTINEENLKEVFDRVGTVKKVVIHYDRSGRSEGSGEITFARKADALTAISKYNGVEVDGKPVRLQIIGSNVSLPARGNRNRNTFRGRRNPPEFLVQSSTRGASRRVRIGGNRGGGRGRGRGGRRYL